MGYDDIPIAAHTVPALTTLRMPIVEIVNEGVRLAIEFARDGSIPRDSAVTYFEPSLIVRESTAPPTTEARPSPSQVSTPVA